MKNIIQATARGGERVYLNISDEACMRFGFKHGQRIIDPRDDKGVVMGVAPTKAGDSVLWFAFDDDRGDVCYWDVNVDLREEGFRRIDISTEEVLNEMVICFRVVASTNGKTEAVIVRDVAIAAAQGRAFRQAGHKDFSVSPVMVLFDKCGTKGDVFGDEFIEIAAVHNAPVPSRYQRADLYPGIKVRAYDREVLRRRVTGMECAVAIIVAMVLMIAMLLLMVDLGMLAAKFFNPFAVVGVCSIFVFWMLLGKESSRTKWCVDCGAWVAGIEDGV